MLSDAERAEIEEELARYPDKQAASVEALKVVQRHRGWVSDEALGEVAHVLEMTPAELDSVATFYSLLFRRPVGEHVVLVCDSISCWVVGYAPILRHFKERYGISPGETTADNRFTLLPIPCLGACDGAPALMVDDDLHLDVTSADKLEAILARYPKGGSDG
jgi:NADH-quinone oxidoreductase subunit E